MKILSLDEVMQMDGSPEEVGYRRGVQQALAAVSSYLDANRHIDARVALRKAERIARSFRSEDPIGERLRTWYMDELLRDLAIALKSAK